MVMALNKKKASVILNKHYNYRKSKERKLHKNVLGLPNTISIQNELIWQRYGALSSIRLLTESKLLFIIKRFNVRL